MSRTSSRGGLGCGRLILIVVAVAIVYSGVRYFIDQSSYAQAYSAYREFDCSRAIPAYNNILNGWRISDFGNYAASAASERAECRALQFGVDKQNAGEWGSSLTAYNDFVTNHGGSPLAANARSRSATLFNQLDSQVLASQGICPQLDAFLGNDLVPQRDTHLPNLYMSCGQVYESSNDFESAGTLYERLLKEYPNHSLASQAEAALARVIVAVARSSGAGTISAPERSGSASTGSTVVIIQNESPTRLQIVFSGPEPRIEELSECPACTKFSGDGPEFCPEKGPIGRYTLKPGDYDVVVKSISGSTVTPWSGDWALGNGDEYFSCFFIVTTSTP